MDIERKLYDSIEERAAFIGKRIREQCNYHNSRYGDDCESCQWYDDSLDVGCVWRIGDDTPPHQWKIKKEEGN